MLEDAIVSAINVYRKFISPVLPSSCRYYPSCSTYAVLSIRKYGAFRGSLKAIYRVLRCNPFSKGGVDYP